MSELASFELKFLIKSLEPIGNRLAVGLPKPRIRFPLSCQNGESSRWFQWNLVDLTV